MDYSFETKYKERKPLDTVKIIQDFFISKGYEIEDETEYRSESQSWYAGVKLYYKKHLVQRSNGKGFTEDFCRASGYAELYERYCNKINYADNPFLNNRILNIHYQNTGYYYDKNEKMLTIDELLQYDRDFVDNTQDQPGMLEHFLTTVFENRFIGIPYINVNNDSDKIYYDPRMLPFARSSSGMAAGNNFYEAFNQGMSEILEHHVSGLYMWDPYDKYYEIDLTKLTNPTLKRSIKSIEDSGHKVKVFDFSYNTGFPVVMVVVFTHGSNLISANIGAFPIFDIALERTITEIYQGTNDLAEFRQEGQMPYRNDSPVVHEGTSTTSITLKNAFPEDILFKAIKVDKPSDIYLNNYDANNMMIFQYYQNLIKNHNLNVYYYNNSYINEMYSISIIVPNLSILRFYKLNKLSNKKLQIYNFALDAYYYFKDLIDNHNINFSKFQQLMTQTEKFDTDDNNLVGQLIHDNWFLLFNLKDPFGIATIKDIYAFYHYYDQLRQILIKTSLSERKNIITKYITLYKYSFYNTYSLEEIKTIMNYFDLNFSDEDYKNILNPAYFITKCYLEPLYNDYHTYPDYINLLASYP